MARHKAINVEPHVHGSLKVISEEQGIPMARLVEMASDMMRDGFEAGEVDIWWDVARKKYRTRSRKPKEIFEECQDLIEEGMGLEEIMEETGLSKVQVETLGSTWALERCLREWEHKWNSMRLKESVPIVAEECHVTERFALRVLNILHGKDKCKRHEKKIFDKIREVKPAKRRVPRKRK